MTMTCSQCSGTRFEPGFVADSGQSSQGFVRWVAGHLDRGVFGGARLRGRTKVALDAHRCTECGHLELYARRG